MGNQLTGIAPSQILPVDHYLTDVADYEFQASLGSTRFFKVARARFKEGQTVVKVFVIQDPSLPIKLHLQKIENIKQKLLGASNCLPFQRITLSDKAVLLYRQFVKDSLYDRISTRPFLINIDKKWLAFQLLCALNQCHKYGVCHGDIKSENVMVTGWNWVLLTDFASFKPTYLPEDNPSDFSYFFDTSRRRTCYIAPERFVESSWRNLDPSGQAENIDLTTSEVKEGNLTPAMDIFSLGCVITELFTEGSPPFDLSQLLSYMTGEYSPADVINKIEDPHIKELVSHMVQKDPSQRLSAEEYLVQQRGRAFPDYFYTFLKMYMQRFASPPLVPPDDRIHKIKKDFGTITTSLGVSKTDVNQNHCLVLVSAMVTTSIRSLWFSHSKLAALELMIEISKHLPADIILDRLLPYMLHFVNDRHPLVRAGAIRTIAQCLADIKVVPASEANVFPEYVLPAMSALTHDPVSQVRVAYAENIASLAETALRFLETVQLESNGKAADSEGSHEMTSTYDMELQALQEIVQQKVSTLISDHDNEVKLTLLENGITPLCVFFGRQKANDVLLSHMITFLNDKQDWHLRGAFFDSIVGVATYVGWQSSSILQPLLQQGLSDPEEFVIHKALSAMTSLTELGLLQKPVLHDMLREVVPFLCHPGMWVKQGAVGFISAVARVLNIADVHCNMLPLIKPFLKQPVIQVDQEVVILHALQDPVPRSIFDYVIRCQHIEALFECLHDRHIIRNMARVGHKPSYSEVNETMSQIFRKLFSMGLTELHEEKLLTLKDFMVKIHRARAGSSEPLELDTSRTEGMLNLGELQPRIQKRHETLDSAALKQQLGQAVPSKKSHKKKQTTSDSMNEDWKQMFGSSSPSKGSPEKTKLSESAEKQKGKELDLLSPSPGTHETTMTMSKLEVKVEGSKPQPESPRPASPTRPAIQARYTPCILSLRDLVIKKREEYANEQLKKEVLDEASWDKKLPPSNWKPQGLLVAHLHEHRAAVNRIKVSNDHHFFATCANDGSVKLWDCSRVEGKSVTNRSRQTYTKQGGQIKYITFCLDNKAVASVSDNGTINVLQIDPSGNRFTLVQDRTVEIQETGHVVDVNYYDSGSQSVLVYATVNGNLIGWDLRSGKLAWSLQNKPKHGLITSFDIHAQQNWMGVGTSSGTLVCWDMRFQLPITNFSHPTGARVRCLLTNPLEQSQVICASQGNNEVSMWEMETGARQRTLWASSAPPLSLTQTSSHSVNGMCHGYTENNNFLLTAGSDMRIRYWDLGYPPNSHIVALAARDPNNQTLVSYRSRIIDGTEVIQEMYTKRQGSGSDDNTRRSPDTPPPGHHDIITDIDMFQTTQCFIVTCSRDGVVKVWK